MMRRRGWNCAQQKEKKSDKICERSGEIERNRQMYAVTSMKPSLCLYSLLTLWVWHFFEVPADLCTSLSIEVYLLVLAICEPKTTYAGKSHVLAFANISGVCYTMRYNHVTIPVPCCQVQIFDCSFCILVLLFFSVFFDGVVMITNQRECLYEANNIQYIPD